jgi:hypothetical protein
VGALAKKVPPPPTPPHHARTRVAGRGIISRSRDAPLRRRHCEEQSDEAIQSGASDWIASRHFMALAMTRRSRDAPSHPSYATAHLKTDTTDFIRCSMRSRSRPMPVEALAKRRFGTDDGRARTVRTKEKMSEAKRRQTQGSSAVPKTGTAAPGSSGAHLSAFHRGSRPKEFFIARDSASGQASWDVAGTRFAHPFERHYPPLPVPQSSAHRAPRS